MLDILLARVYFRLKIHHEFVIKQRNNSSATQFSEQQFQVIHLIDIFTIDYNILFFSKVLLDVFEDSLDVCFINVLLSQELPRCSRNSIIRNDNYFKIQIGHLLVNYRIHDHQIMIANIRTLETVFGVQCLILTWEFIKRIGVTRVYDQHFWV